MSNNDNFIKQYNNEVYAKTKKYQKMYGFEIGTGEHDTWNNEADAFKHTFMQADLALKFLTGISKYAGDKHENDGKKQGQPQDEENMDRWNNAQGREIAKEISKEINKFCFIENVCSQWQIRRPYSQKGYGTNEGRKTYYASVR